MRRIDLRLVLMLVLSSVVSGCKDTAVPKPKTEASPVATDDKFSANLSEDRQQDEAELAAEPAKLSPEDRKLAEAQKFCATENENRLGAMGVPVKLLVKGEPVFVCCKGCVKEVNKNPDKAFASVQKLKAGGDDTPTK